MQHPSQKPFTLRGGKVFGGGRLLACVPLISGDVNTLIKDAEETCAAAPDILEWRADYFGAIREPEEVARAARALREAAGEVPVLFTPRIPAEGGQTELDPETKKAVIRAVCATGCVDLVDVELCFDDAYLKEIRDIADQYDVKLVLSYHNFDGMPELSMIEEMLRRAEKMGADVNKLALMPKNFHDVAVFARFLCEAKESWMKNPVIASLMGDVGAVSRFGGGSLGSDLCFVAVTGVSGPGQMHIRDYRILNALIDG